MVSKYFCYHGKIISAILVGNSTKATMADLQNSLKSDLLRAKELSDNEVPNLCESLVEKQLRNSMLLRRVSV